MAKGLSYLHRHKVIYRDLKTENILMVSRDLAAPVNIKLSDYGISKFATAQGLVGLVGTPGYIAPEIIQGLAYDEKASGTGCKVTLHCCPSLSPLLPRTMSHRGWRKAPSRACCRVSVCGQAGFLQVTRLQNLFHT